MREEARQAVLDAIGELISTDDPWTSRRELRQKTRDGTGETVLPVTKREADGLIRKLVGEGELLYWHGLVTLTEDEYLNAVIEKEREAEVTRTILIGKVNKIRAGTWDFSQEKPAESLTPGGDA